MSLDYASFPESAGQELLQIHEREDNNGYAYNLHDTESKKISSNPIARIYSKLTTSIPPQDLISKRKEKIEKWHSLAVFLLVVGTLFGFWIYNSRNRITTLDIEEITSLKLPMLRICLPFISSVAALPHYIDVREFNLSHIREPNDYHPAKNIRPVCTSISGLLNNCDDFMEFDGACLNIGKNNWTLATNGRDLISFVMVYPHQPSLSAHNLVFPFFGWISNCTTQRDGSLHNVDHCTQETHWGLFKEETRNHMVWYQLEPNQFTVLEVRKEVHVNSTGNRTEIYPTTMIYFPFMKEDNSSFIYPFCKALGIPGSCDVISIGIRTLSQSIQTTYAERYWFSVLRSLGTTAALLEVILVICTAIFSAMVTKLMFTEKHAHLDHDLREAIIYMHKVMRSNNGVINEGKYQQ